MQKKDIVPSVGFESVLILDGYSKKNYIFNKNRIEPASKISFSKSQSVASYINTKDMIVSSVAINRNIDDEDIKDVLEIKAYEELGLDETQEYIIEHKEIESNNEDRQLALFAIRTSSLYSLFGDLKKNIQYIDFIIPAPLLYTVLYEKEILKQSGVDVFIYIDYADAFISVYKNGEFLYTKSIDYSLDRIHERYCQSVESSVDKSQFYNVLQSDGVNGGNGISGDVLSKIFSDFFISINDISIYTKRAFNIDSFDNIYIGSSLGLIHGIKEYSATYLGKRSEELDFSYGIKSGDWGINQLNMMLILKVKDLSPNDQYISNLTIFKRPPPFAQRTGGKFIMALAGALFLALVYPLYFLVSSYVNDFSIYNYKSDSDSLAGEVSKYKSIISQKEAEFKQLTNDNISIVKAYESKVGTLDSIYNKKANYKMKAKTFVEFTQDLQSRGVNVSDFGSIDNNFSLSLISKDDKKITDLIEYISTKYYKDIKNIDIKVIEKDQNSSYYSGILKMELK